MTRTQARMRPSAETAPAPSRAPKEAPAAGTRAPYILECVGCYRVARLDASATGGYAWMCRSFLESRHGPVTSPNFPDLCPICVEALS